MNDQPAPISEFILYTSEDGQTRVECRFEEETIWLSQALIAELYTRSKKTISEHLQNLFEEAELLADSVVRNFRTTVADGKSYEVQHRDPGTTQTGFRSNFPEIPDSSNGKVHSTLLLKLLSGDPVILDIEDSWRLLRD